MKTVSNKKIILAGVVLMALEALFFLRFGQGINVRLHRLTDKVSTDTTYTFMHKKVCDISSLPKLQDDTTAWYAKYHLIAHGGGGINGKNYTNSLEAWNLTYARGNRVIDADLRFTTDSVLVLRHSWSDNLEQDKQTPMMKSNRFLDSNGHLQNNLSKGIPMDLATFKSFKVYGLYTPMTYLDMLEYLSSHRDLYVACDIKGGNSFKGDIKKTYTYMVDVARQYGFEDILQNLIISCYDYEDYDAIMAIYPFKNVTMRQHYVSPNNYYVLCKFCVEHDIHTINLWFIRDFA
jgi:glycerophosphoryl diester phosphodiesterase